GEGGPAVEPVAQCGAGGLADGDASNLGPLAEHGQQALREVGVAELEATALADAEPGPVEDLEDGEVAPGQRAGDGVVALAGEVVDLLRSAVEQGRGLGRARHAG